MSKWRKALKNKRRFDARYFLNERVEGQEEVIENSVQQEKVKRNFHDFSFDSWLTEDQGLKEAHCTSKRDDKVNEEDSTQTILDLIKQRIKEVGFGKETEEDFDAAKIELVDDYPDKEDEIDRITFDQFFSLNEEDLDEMHCTSKRDDKINEEDLEEMHCTSKRDDKRERLKEEKKDCKPDYPDLNKDGDKNQCISDAAKDLKAKNDDKKRKNEIVGPQGKEPTFAPKTGEEEATGIKPHIVKILKQREKYAHLGPVPDDLKPEKNEG